MAFVLDASLAAAWCLPDEAEVLAESVLDRLREEPGLVPTLFWYEIRSVFLNAERRGRIDTSEVSEAMTWLRQLPIFARATTQDLEVLSVARRHQLSAYDASYLALAVAEDCPFASLDRRLNAAALAEGLALLD